MRRRLGAPFAPGVVAEGIIVRRIDRATQLILLAAFISMLFSIYLWFFEDKDAGVFVGIWVPSILAFGALMRSSR